jgi:hypothetical protein
MDRKKDRRLALGAAFACAAVVMFASCAQRILPGNSTRAISAGPPTTRDAGRAPAGRPATPPAAIERKPKLLTIVPRREATRAEQIITLVREGYLVDEARGTLVFSKSRSANVPATALYEDAILLGRLRLALKETEGIPDSLSATATVRDAKAFLTIEGSLPAPEAARAINAALRTPGVNAVQARISG